MLTKTIPWRFLCTVLSALTLAATAQASEQDAGGQQICTAKTLDAVGHFLKTEPFSMGGVVVAAACKSFPSDRSLTLVSAAYDGNIQDGKALVIALVDEPRGQVVSSYRGAIEEHAAMRIVASSLRLDTPPYVLAPGVRAFGLDLTSKELFHPCIEGGWGTIRTLYVREGAQIRPVLVDLIKSEWGAVQGTANCPTSPEPPIIESFKLTLSMSRQSSHGYRDIVVTARSSRDDGLASTRQPFRHTLHYDGRMYDQEGMRKAFSQWRAGKLTTSERP